VAHDALILSFVDQDGKLIREAVSTDDFPSPPAWANKLKTGERDAFVIHDLRITHSRRRIGETCGAI